MPNTNFHLPYPKSHVIGHINHYAQRIVTHPNSINTIGGVIAPNQNALRANMINHGF